jgi:hypothetical protein
VPFQRTFKTVKLKTNVRGLDVVQSVYAFAMALGLTQVFTGSQVFLTRILSGTASLTDEKTILVGFLLANVAMLGLRFFWVPRNLQGLVITAARVLAMATHRDRVLYLSNYVIAYHLVLILLQGMLFFLICGEFEFIMFSVSSNLPLDSSVFLGYIIMHVALLLINAAWIALIQRQEGRLQRRLHTPAGSAPKSSAGNVWWRNNLVSSLFALSPFALSSTCKSASAQCARQSLEGSTGLMTLFPTSPQVFATVYYDVVGALSYFAITSPYMAVYWVFVVLLFNSGYDLLKAGRFYVFFEDVEWESTIEDAKVEEPLER